MKNKNELVDEILTEYPFIKDECIEYINDKIKEMKIKLLEVIYEYRLLLAQEKMFKDKLASLEGHPNSAEHKNIEGVLFNIANSLIGKQDSIINGQSRIDAFKEFLTEIEKDNYDFK